jgi:NTP pyrophosphatase (non-canonical NTP hydrolase)
MSDDRWNLKDAVQRITAFRDERDWQQFHRPKEVAAALAIEAAELQELFLWRDPETAEEVRADGERLHRVREEIADCAIFMLLLSNDLGVDLAEAICLKVDSNAKRYVADKHRGRAVKAPPDPSGSGDNP